ncbi:MAG: DUF4301 family protein [Bacteroidales bacterium]|nr:DUF4301 family protein [Bacteroidales bacterium]
MKTFSDQQIKFFEKKGFDISTIFNQLDQFKKGTKFLNLLRPARLVDGIERLDEQRISNYLEVYNQQKKQYKIAKFIPASGAATRMFKSLYSFLEDGKENSDVGKFISGIKKFAFYNDLKLVIAKDGLSIDQLLKTKDYKTVVEYLVTDKGLSYGNLPKGLLRFHINSMAKAVTPVYEHIKEAIDYVGEKAHLEFTVQENFKDAFISAIEEAKEQLNANQITYNISFQKSHTDTIAVYADNSPVVLEDETILLRPGGHGALLDNLNDIEADIVFVKNIDNVCAESVYSYTSTYKKILAGKLIDIKHQIAEHLSSLENYDGQDEKFNLKIRDFIEHDLGVFWRRLCAFTPAQKVQYFKEILNRPIRVCGMVKNEGEPGGGPFWVKDDLGRISLQIVESSQIDLKNEEQASILKDASHFNPVDLVCSLSDVNGKKIDLKSFTDPDAVFISGKSYQGKDILALEHPGLWNGAMANWSTIFVEIPIETFNPVKTINDLLRKEHQN